MDPKPTNSLSNLVSGRLPEFVRVDHPTLVAFLEAYYEWLQEKDRSGKILSPMVLEDVIDIDSSIDEFLNQFKNQFLYGFPEKLAISQETGNPVDPRKLMKNIKAFYRSKGTEKSYEFLFRVLYDASVEFYYPKRDVLRVSDAKWYESTSIKISNSLGDEIYNSVGQIVYQRDDEGKIISSAKVLDVTVYQQGPYDVAELSLTNRSGNFFTGSRGIQYDFRGKTYRELRVYSVVGSVNILSGGANYRIGDRIRFVASSGDSGEGAEGVVSLVTITGGIRKIRIDNFGINYEKPPTIAIQSLGGSGFSGTVTTSGICAADGYYLNDDGRLDSKRVLQDNHYYQDFSYVLRTEVVIDEYRDAIRKLVHPAGMAMFGQVLIKRCAREDIFNSSALIRYEVPYIGNYAPYTFNTFDNLQDWFSIEGTGNSAGTNIPAGYSPSLHDMRITGGIFDPSLPIQETTIGNPITNSIEFLGATGPSHPTLGTTGFANGYPFWFVYEHPNRKIQGPVIAQVWKNQIDDFVKWNEWCSITGGDPYSGWTADFYDSPGMTAVEKKYAFLNYDETSAFRKITARSFFEMPIGEAFDCKTESRVSFARPRINITNPLNSSNLQSGSVSPGSPLVVSFTVENPGNLEYYGGSQSSFRVLLDGSEVASLNRSQRTAEIFAIGFGSHTIRVEFVDGLGKQVTGVSDSVVFGYNDPAASGGGETGSTTPPTPPWWERFDHNRDGVLDFGDYGLLIGQLNSSNPLFDYNNDGIVDGADLGEWLSAYSRYIDEQGALRAAAQAQMLNPPGTVIPYGESFSGFDFDGDGRITFADLGLLLGAWGTNNPKFDYDGNGVVSGADLGAFMVAFSEQLTTEILGTNEGPVTETIFPPKFKILVDAIPTTGFDIFDKDYEQKFANAGIEKMILVNHFDKGTIDGVPTNIVSVQRYDGVTPGQVTLNHQAFIRHLNERGIQPNSPRKKYVSLNLEEEFWDKQVNGQAVLGQGISADVGQNGTSNTYVSNALNNLMAEASTIYGPNVKFTPWGYPYLPWYFSSSAFPGAGTDPNGPWWSTTPFWKEQRVAWTKTQFQPIYASAGWMNPMMYDAIPQQSDVESGLVEKNKLLDNEEAGVEFNYENKGSLYEEWMMASYDVCDRIKTALNKGDDFEIIPCLTRYYVGRYPDFYFNTANYGYLMPISDVVQFVRKLKDENPSLSGISFWGNNNYMVTGLVTQDDIAAPGDPNYFEPTEIPEWASWFDGTLEQWREYAGNDARVFKEIQRAVRESYIRVLYNGISPFIDFESPEGTGEAFVANGSYDQPTLVERFYSWQDNALKIDLTRRYNEYTLEMVRQIRQAINEPVIPIPPEFLRAEDDLVSVDITNQIEPLSCEATCLPIISKIPVEMLKIFNIIECLGNATTLVDAEQAACWWLKELSRQRGLPEPNCDESGVANTDWDFLCGILREFLRDQKIHLPFVCPSDEPNCDENCKKQKWKRIKDIIFPILISKPLTPIPYDLTQTETPCDIPNCFDGWPRPPQEPGSPPETQGMPWLCPCNDRNGNSPILPPARVMATNNTSEDKKYFRIKETGTLISARDELVWNGQTYDVIQPPPSDSDTEVDVNEAFAKMFACPIVAIYNESFFKKWVDQFNDPQFANNDCVNRNRPLPQRPPQECINCFDRLCALFRFEGFENPISLIFTRALYCLLAQGGGSSGSDERTKEILAKCVDAECKQVNSGRGVYIPQCGRVFSCSELREAVKDGKVDCGVRVLDLDRIDDR